MEDRKCYNLLNSDGVENFKSDFMLRPRAKYVLKDTSRAAWSILKATVKAAKEGAVDIMCTIDEKMSAGEKKDNAENV